MIVGFGQILIFLGLMLLISGIVFLFAPDWQLPGDLSFSAGNMRFYFPLATSLVLSIVLSVALNFFMAVIRR